MLAEGGGGAESRLVRDAVHGQVGGLQQAPRVVDALLGQPLAGSDAGFVAEAPRERAHAHLGVAGQFGQRERPDSFTYRPSGHWSFDGAILQSVEKIQEWEKRQCAQSPRIRWADQGGSVSSRSIVRNRGSRRCLSGPTRPELTRPTG